MIIKGRKSNIRASLRDWLDNWNDANVPDPSLMDEKFTIYYDNGDIVYISIYEYEGQKIRKQGISNIIYSDAYSNMDYYHDDLDKEIDDMDEYYKKWESGIK